MRTGCCAWRRRSWEAVAFFGIERPSAEWSFKLIEVAEANYPVVAARRPRARLARWPPQLTERIRAIHTMTRRSHGSPRVWSEPRFGDGVPCSRKRVERLMRVAGLQGLHRCSLGLHPQAPRRHALGERGERQLTVDEPNQLWVSTSRSTSSPRATGLGVYTSWSSDSFLSTLQREVLVAHRWRTRHQSAHSSSDGSGFVRPPAPAAEQRPYQPIDNEHPGFHAGRLPQHDHPTHFRPVPGDAQLYSIPANLIGFPLDALADAALVKVFLRGRL